MCAHSSEEGRHECYEEEVSSSFEDDDFENVQYLRDMVCHYTEHMLLYGLGFMPAHDFLPETLNDVYSGQLYCMSWFYIGIYPFDSWELEYDDYLRGEVQNEFNCD